MKSVFPFRRTLRKAVLLVTGVSAIGCSTGAGEGSFQGGLYVKNCKKEKGRFVDYGTLQVPELYELTPGFFAGEPIEDIEKGGSTNRLIIRLQSSGKQVESTDLLTFNVVDSHEVARCVRGLVWDSVANELRPDYNPKHCWRGPSGTGPARLRVGPDQPIRVYFAPRAECPENDTVVATALDRPLSSSGGTARPPLTPDDWQSWIEIEQFGGAALPPETPPQKRARVPANFKVDFGERLEAAHFRLVMADDRQVVAEDEGEDPDDIDAEIGAIFEGSFAFELRRGQGAQTFP